MYEALYSKYLEFLSDVNEDGFRLVKCPLSSHKNGVDNKPSAGVNIYNGIYNCFGNCGSMSPYTFLQRLLEITKEDAYTLVEEFVDEQCFIDKSLVDDIKYIKSPAELGNIRNTVEISKLLINPDEILVKEYLQSRNLSYDTLIRKGVGFLPAEKLPDNPKRKWKRDSLVIPYTLNGKIIGVRYRDILGHKGSETDSSFHIYSIDEVEEQPIIILVEGETDCFKTFETLDYEYTVISTPTSTFNKEWARCFQDVGQVIVIHQADEAAEKFVIKCRKYLGEKYTPLELPWGRKDVGKDVCDWIGIHGKEEFNNLIQSVIIPKSRRIMNGHELIAEAGAEKPWILENCLQERQSAMIAGYAKSYKTWFALNMIECILTTGSKLCNIEHIKSLPFDRNILFVEEEGNISELKSRAEKVLKDVPDWKDRVLWMHQMGTRLDDPNCEAKLRKHIIDYNIGVVFLDPFQRMFSGDENDSNTIGVVWSTISRLLAYFPHLSIVVIHHYKKSGEDADGLRNIRGSSRIAGEIDLGILCKEMNRGTKVNFKGRSIPHITGPDGKEEFKLVFDEGKLKVEGKIVLAKDEALVKEVDDRCIWPLHEAAEFFGKDTETIKNWAKKHPTEIELIKGNAGQKPYLQIISNKPE